MITFLLFYVFQQIRRNISEGLSNPWLFIFRNGIGEADLELRKLSGLSPNTNVRVIFQVINHLWKNNFVAIHMKLVVEMSPIPPSSNLSSLPGSVLMEKSSRLLYRMTFPQPDIVFAFQILQKRLPVLNAITRHI